MYKPTGKKPGRTPITEVPLDCTVTFRLPRAIVDWIDVIAAKQNISRGTWVSRMITQLYDRFHPVQK